MADLKQQARELLAAEYERDGRVGMAALLREPHDLVEDDDRSVRAIAAALRSAPEAEALRIAMTTLDQIASTPRNKGARMNAKATLLFLQTQLAARPQGVKYV